MGYLESCHCVGSVQGMTFWTTPRDLKGSSESQESPCCSRCSGAQNLASGYQRALMVAKYGSTTGDASRSSWSHYISMLVMLSIACHACVDLETMFCRAEGGSALTLLSPARTSGVPVRLLNILLLSLAKAEFSPASLEGQGPSGAGWP